ncbi:DUF421 domain-containing protein [Loktanella sp. M215]|uniref:DUF421 domain-containing protein n=1 Tax=Loktanella sp. M215 TaxID=2675431 RepID=UPI001F168A6F|nr:YetF domain-containing protein [Loktanella sp. M215]MCF7701740.1 DUF421 domain-containing protein [Loktanella sp. M215]
MFDDPLLYDGVGGLLRTVCAAAIMYLTVVAAVRLFGKRSTSQMNNFDWIVTVAIGSLMASGVLLADVTVLESAAAVYTLLVLQWGLTKIMIHSDKVTKIVKSEPTLLLHRGQILADALRKERLTEAEIHAAVREAGYSRIEDVQWVVLETNSTLSVIGTNKPLGDPNMLNHVGGTKGVLDPSAS